MCDVWRRASARHSVLQHQAELGVKVRWTFIHIQSSHFKAWRETGPEEGWGSTTINPFITVSMKHCLLSFPQKHIKCCVNRCIAAEGSYSSTFPWSFLYILCWICLFHLYMKSLGRLSSRVMFYHSFCSASCTVGSALTCYPVKLGCVDEFGN